MAERVRFVESMNATLPTPLKFNASPDSKVIKAKDGVSAHFSAMHDRLSIVDDDSGLTIVSLRLNGLDPVVIATKYV